MRACPYPELKGTLELLEGARVRSAEVEWNGVALRWDVVLELGFRLTDDGDVTLRAPAWAVKAE